MATAPNHVKLGFSIWATGIHPAGWRLPEANAHGTFDPAFIRDTARTAERGLLDFYFIGDRVVGLPSSQYESPNEVLRPEALTLTAYIAAVTTHIGIVTTVNTTYAEPYTLARATAQLDHLSQGRLAWNIVTGKNEEAAGNFGRDEHWNAEKRYEWTSEFVEVVKGLWDSWEDGALIGDKAAGEFIDESRVHALNHRGKHFSVTGPLNIARPPQGHVPLLHAGSSEESHEFGARYADIRFILLQDTARAKAYYQDLQNRRVKHNQPHQPTIAGLPVYVAGTSREAHQKFRQIQNLTVVEANLSPLSEALGVDITGRRLDTPLSDVPELAGLDGRPALILDRARQAYDDESPTLREVALFLKRTHGKEAAVGNASEVADYIQEQFEERTTDGFIIFPPYLPGPLDAFVDLVVPELQRRDLFKKEYGVQKTFRELFDLPRPENRFTAAAPTTSSRRADYFVSAQELAGLLEGEKPPVLIDVRFSPSGPSLRPEYEAGHIPGAVFADLQTDLAGSGGGLAGRRPLPDPSSLQRRIRDWGISAGTPVVVYDNNSGLTAGRAWWVLTWAGVPDVRLLDGGLAAWQAAGGALSSTEPSPEPGDFTVDAGQLPTIDADEAADLARSGVLLDARGKKAYAGTGAPTEGHIPGALEAGTRGNLDKDGILLDEQELRRRFESLGVLEGQTVGAYCGGGVAAAHEVLVLKSIGVDASLFVGSWSAWSADPSRPVATGVEPA